MHTAAPRLADRLCALFCMYLPVIQVVRKEGVR